MIQSGRANKLKEKNNYDLSELSNDILIKITSLLEIKDAVRTSSLSKRWRYIWVNHPDLRFNHFNILGIYQHKQYKDTLFVRFLDQIMQQRSKGINKINSFCVQFQLGKVFSQSIDEWISCAVRKSVETIDLDFYKFPSNFPLLKRSKRYNFSLLRSASHNKGSLKHLRLAFCNFEGRSSSKIFDSIVSLQFYDVNITNLQLKKVLEGCPLLEKLVLNSCSNLTRLSIVDCNNTLLKTLSLKYLSLTEIDICGNNLIYLELECLHHISRLQLEKLIKSCLLLEELTLHSWVDLEHLKLCDSISPHLKVLSLKSSLNSDMEIDICVNNLHTFEYRGESSRVSFKMEAPGLVNAFISQDKRSSYPITRKCLAMPMLENLVFDLHCNFNVFMFLNNLKLEYSNVKRLVLLDFPYLIEHISWVSCLLKCFPKLQTLELNFEVTLFVMPSKEEIEEDLGIEKCVNGTITRLELNGFAGSQHQVVLLKCLLENLRGLQVLAIGPSYKDYKSSNDWVYSKANILAEEESLQFDSKWIRSIISPIIPPFVRLELGP